MIGLLIYIGVFCVLAAVQTPHFHGARSYFVNDCRSGTAEVGFSLIASCVGGSATLGMAGLAFEAGFPAFWWLGSGAAGLLILTLFLARTVRRSRRLTLPEIVAQGIGPSGRVLISLIISVAWVAILAAQFSAMARVVETISGLDSTSALWLGALFITFYTALGGQAGVLKSDVLQYAVLLLGLIALLAWMLTEPAARQAVADASWLPVNAQFPLSKWTYFMLLVGGSYVVCPMLFTRFLSARSEAVAFRAGLWAVAGLALTALLIVLIGMSASSVIDSATAPDRVLMSVIESTPVWLRTVLLFTLISAIVSSADSCLMTAAGVISNDLLHCPSMTTARISMVLISLGAVLLAGVGKGILELLLMANNLYVCGVVAPVFVLLVTGRRLHPLGGVLAVGTGAVLGLISELTGQTLWSYWAVGLSTLLALASLRANGADDTPV